MADVEEPPPGRVRSFRSARWRSLVEAVSDASTEDKVRGFVALVLVLVLLALVLIPPDGRDELVASSKTLAIAVIAFYFGLHGATPHRSARAERPADIPNGGPGTSASRPEGSDA
jgi:hypothetical protein